MFRLTAKKWRQPPAAILPVLRRAKKGPILGAPVKTGGRQWMKVPYGEGLANHIDPESCACNREVASEALTGERSGQLLSHEMGLSSGRRRCRENRKTTQDTPLSRGVSWSRVVVDPVHERKLPAREPGDPMSYLGSWRQGTLCESQGSTAEMHSHGKSDRPIDTVEAAEQWKVGVTWQWLSVEQERSARITGLPG
jgi:hypothetical protein